MRSREISYGLGRYVPIFVFPKLIRPHVKRFPPPATFIAPESVQLWVILILPAPDCVYVQSMYDFS